jgi:hypothetical protein
MMTLVSFHVFWILESPLLAIFISREGFAVIADSSSNGSQGWVCVLLALFWSALSVLLLLCPA